MREQRCKRPSRYSAERASHAAGRMDDGFCLKERQIHRIYSSDHACRIQTILLEPFTCKRVHATLHSRIFCMGLMLIFRNVQAGFRQVVDVVLFFMCCAALPTATGQKPWALWLVHACQPQQTVANPMCGDKFVRVAASRNSSSRRMLPPT